MVKEQIVFTKNLQFHYESVIVSHSFFLYNEAIGA